MIDGKLLTHDFILDGIRETSAWKTLDDDEVLELGNRLQNLLSIRGSTGDLNEAATESEVILPILEAIGWEAHLPQQTVGGSGRCDVPDILLFIDQDSKENALREATEEARYAHGCVIVESKRLRRDLDRRRQGGRADTGLPSGQMLRYLSRAEVMSDRRIQWGFLTNGVIWRLYWQGAKSRVEEYLEIDLGVVLDGMAAASAPDAGEVEPVHALRVFLLFFGRNGFLSQPDDPEGRTFHTIALTESKLWEERVSENLGEVVFTTVFPALVNALLKHDSQAGNKPTGEYLEEVRHAGLVFLYRLLFVLYAEDRNLLPVHDDRYDDYSLRVIRTDIAQRTDVDDSFSNSAHRYHQHLKDLFTAIARGDDSIGLPPYDGGLFDPEGSPLLERVALPDSEIAQIVDHLSRQEVEAESRWINYRDLTVKQLGSVYERLLEYDIVLSEEDAFSIRPNIFARKGSGSYYTHDDLVRTLVDRTLRPLIAEKIDCFEEELAQLSGRSASESEVRKVLANVDPAQALLELKVCDPAVGSGHFLVSVVDYLADQAIELISLAEAVAFGDLGVEYISPLSERISRIRGRILEDAERQGWAIAADTVTERQIIRRIILKRVIHGVDKNPMAVELAKLSLWLHTFTVGAPLSFLDHHLTCGDSLFGERVGNVVEELQQTGGLFLHSELTGLNNSMQMMQQISELSDVDIAEVNESKELFAVMDRTLEPLRKFLDFRHALKWMGIRPGGSSDSPYQTTVNRLIHGEYGKVIEVVATGAITDMPGEVPASDVERLKGLLADAQAIADREQFLHWEIAFPTVWSDLLAKPKGGFDAVVGNPPWDRMKLQEVEWFATRAPEIAGATRAADRKRMISELEESTDPLWQDYRQARERAETATALVRESPEYPLLATGDINIYSLFVERAEAIINDKGIVGVVVPSGIAGDKSASSFFRKIAGSGRLACLLDFENKKVFFPDIHASFKFCLFVYGGAERRFAATECGFFLHTTGEVFDKNRVFSLSPDDFETVNPNTGTAPIFRSRRDAELSTSVYRRFPVLVDRRESPPHATFGFKYNRMFDLTNDSHLFKSAGELEEEGYYRIEGNRWRRGEEVVVPLYEGKMVQAYDHRAASVVVHEENIHRPGQPEPADADQHGDPSWLPTPQYWVPEEIVPGNNGVAWQVGFKDVTAPTNMRTMIAAVVPRYGLGNSLPSLDAPEDGDNSDYKRMAPLLLANLNSFVFDYLARQKVQGQHINLYILEQLPVIPLASYLEELGSTSAEALVREHVLELSYVSEDMHPFAVDLGFDGNPFPWDEDRRRHLRARLDALYFHLYGLSRDEIAYILDGFQIVRSADEKATGRYFTRDLIIAYYNALGAGDAESMVAL